MIYVTSVEGDGGLDLAAYGTEEDAQRALDDAKEATLAACRERGWPDVPATLTEADEQDYFGVVGTYFGLHPLEVQ